MATITHIATAVPPYVFSHEDVKEAIFNEYHTRLTSRRMATVMQVLGPSRTPL
jgi:hypothetical protein